MPEKSLRLMLYLLVGTLLLNLFTLSKVNSLSNQVANLQNNTPDRNFLQRVIAQGTGNLEATVRQIKEEQRWVTPLQVEIGEVAGQTVPVQLSWQVRDYPQGAEVTFFYRASGAEDFQALPATPTGGGRFQVELAVEPRLTPEWSIEQVFSSPGKTVDSKAQRVVEEKSNMGSLDYAYYIAMQEGERVRSTDVENLNLGKLAQILTAPLMVKVESDEKEQVHRVTLLERPVQEPMVKIARVFLEGSAAGEKRAETQLVVSGQEQYGNQQVPVYQGTLSQSFNHLSLRVEYENGQSVLQVIPIRDRGSD